MRVLTVTPNAAWDRTVYLARLRAGARNRARAEFEQAGGKGVNVARLLAALGASVRAVAVVGGAAGRAIRDDLARAGFAADFVDAPGESRTCLEIVEEEEGNRITQLHGVGVQGSDAVADALVGAVRARLAKVDWLALCGSLAPGFSEDVYARLLRIARDQGVRVALDASGAPLRNAWSAGADLLRINRTEAEEAFGAGWRATIAGSTGGRSLRVVSDGERAFGAWSDRGTSWTIEAPRVDARNPIGCGDAMLAGLLAYRGELHAEGALRFATALAAAAAESPVAGRASLERARALAPTIRIDACEP